MRFRQFLVVMALVLLGSQARADDWFADNAAGLRWGAFYANPGAPSDAARNVNKTILNVAHFDVWKYGTNFINVDVLFSNANEPNRSGGGSTELYAVYRGQLSPDKIFGISTAVGPVIQAINFEFGGDVETENTEFAPNKKVLVVGPNFHFNMPAGFMNLGVHAYKEWNANGIVGRNVSFAMAPEFELVWLYPLSFMPWPMDFRGFMNITGPKGKNGFGNNTYWEILARPQLQLDVGKLLFNKPHMPDVYLAVEFWQNKFGNGSYVTGTEQIAPTIGVEIHF